MCKHGFTNRTSSAAAYHHNTQPHGQTCTVRYGGHRIAAPQPTSRASDGERNSALLCPQQLPSLTGAAVAASNGSSSSSSKLFTARRVDRIQSVSERAGNLLQRPPRHAGRPVVEGRRGRQTDRLLVGGRTAKLSAILSDLSRQRFL